MPSASHVGVAIVIGSALLTGGASSPALAQSPAPETQPPAPSWPSGDQLRSSLQQIDFAFRIDADSGDWLGWAPRATSAELPALGLSGAGTQDALTSFDFSLIEGDTGPPLTAFMEVAARLPLDPVDVDQARRFVVDDLLEMPPETLEACYLSDWRVGAALVTVDTETTTARLQLASSVAALESRPGPGFGRLRGVRASRGRGRAGRPQHRAADRRAGW